jgi:hypothetical protein
MNSGETLKKTTRKGDKAIRLHGVDQFAHRDLVPLDQVDLSKSSQVDMFNEECEGMCGV